MIRRAIVFGVLLASGLAFCGCTGSGRPYPGSYRGATYRPIIERESDGTPGRRRGTGGFQGSSARGAEGGFRSGVVSGGSSFGF